MYPVEAINTGLLTLLYRYWKRMMRACCELVLYEMDWRLASYTTKCADNLYHKDSFENTVEIEGRNRPCVQGTSLAHLLHLVVLLF